MNLTYIVRKCEDKEKNTDEDWKIHFISNLFKNGIEKFSRLTSNVRDSALTWITKFVMYINIGKKAARSTN